MSTTSSTTSQERTKAAATGTATATVTQKQHLQEIGVNTNTQPASILLENNQSTQNALSHKDAGPLLKLMEFLNNSDGNDVDKTDEISRFVDDLGLEINVRPQFHPVKRERDNKRMIALLIPKRYVAELEKEKFDITSKTIAKETLHYAYLDNNRAKIFFDAKSGSPIVNDQGKPICPKITKKDMEITWGLMDDGTLDFTQLNALIEKSSTLKKKSSYILEIARRKGATTTTATGKNAKKSGEVFAVDNGAYLKFHYTQREINLGGGKIGINDMHIPNHSVWTLSLWYDKEVVKCTYNHDLKKAYYIPANPSTYGNCKQNLSKDQCEMLIGEINSSVKKDEKDKVSAVKKALFRWAHQPDPEGRELPEITDKNKQKLLVTSSKKTKKG